MLGRVARRTSYAPPPAPRRIPVPGRDGIRNERVHIIIRAGPNRVRISSPGVARPPGIPRQRCGAFTRRHLPGWERGAFGKRSETELNSFSARYAAVVVPAVVPLPGYALDLRAARRYPRH